MTEKYGFGEGIKLPKTPKVSKPRPKVKPEALNEAVRAGNDLGFIAREPNARRKPGPKRREPQDKVSIPGPKRVIDSFRAYCTTRDVTLWQGLEALLNNQKGTSD